MASQEVTQAGVWDDTELIEAWDSALAEYKKYHSLAARGEKIKAKDLAAEASVSDSGQPQVDPNVLPDQQSSTGDPLVETKHIPSLDSAADAHQVSTGTNIMHAPEKIFSSMQDESMKNLMMSWYYAGYYTGFYEGQLKARDGQQRPDEPK